MEYSYVFYLETRVGYLEKVLQEHNISFIPAEVLDQSSRPGADPTTVHTPSDDGPPYNGTDSSITKQSPQEVAWSKKQDASDKLNKLVSNIGSVSVQGASDSRYLGSTSGISFARVVFAAVKSSVSGTNSEYSGVKPSKPHLPSKAVSSGGGTSMRDSFFGLHTKPTIKQAPFPDKEIGRRLVDFYFEHANPQIPILHRGEFMRMFELAYADGEARVRTPRELYMLNMVFAIGSGIFLGEGFRSDLARPGAALYGVNPTPGRSNPMRQTIRLAAPVLQLRSVQTGERVGYNGAWTAARDSIVATVALGYADGYHRSATNRAEAAFDGVRLPLIGRVSMDLLTFDATDAPGLMPGAMLELIGPAVTPDEVAGWTGTNGYEVLTSLGHRAHRVAAAL